MAFIKDTDTRNMELPLMLLGIETRLIRVL